MKKKSEIKTKDAGTQNSRRGFIRNAALAAAGFYIVPRHVLGRGFVAPSDKLQVAGVGAGGKGTSDLRSILESGKADVPFLCDVDTRQITESVKRFPNAKIYKDYREMLDKEHKNIDAVTASIPDHMHAVVGMAAMQLKKHVYIQKPLSHDIYEARMLTKAAHDNKVVTQMGNQGSSGDGVRQLQEWYNAGKIGEVHTITCFTNRPVWPQGIPWSSNKPPVPQGLDWNLWLGTAPSKDYVEKLVPFNWRGWWDYGTGALGDMACHIMAPAFAVLNLGYPISAECSMARPYVENWTPGNFPESGPVASSITLTFEGKKGKKGKTNNVKLTWMDGGILPARPEELGPNELLGDGGDGGAIFEGTKGKMMCGTYGKMPTLLPTALTAQANVPKTLARVKGGESGHQAAWVEACIAGYGSKEAKELSSNFDIAGPLTESVLMGNLAIRSYNIGKPGKDSRGRDTVNYPGRGIKLLWDGPNMKITNFDEANQFVKRTYRDGYSLGV